MNSRIQAVLSHLEPLRNQLSYEDFKAEAEKAALALLAAAPEGLWFSAFTELPLWLAAHRLAKSGRAVGPHGGTFRLAAAA